MGSSNTTTCSHFKPQFEVFVLLFECDILRCLFPKVGIFYIYCDTNLTTNTKKGNHHLIASINEWLMTGVVILTFTTFYPDFKRISLKQPEVYAKDYDADRKLNLIVLTF